MELMSESSVEGKSFGLLDDNLLQDLTLNGNNSSEKIAKIKEKPPIPTTTRKKSLNNNSNTQQPEFNEFVYEQPNVDPAEETAVSIKLNESDLKELDDEFTFADSDEENEQKNEENNRTLNKDSSSNKNDVFSNLFNKEIFKNDLILNESADILRNSNEFLKKPMSYDMTMNDESKLMSTNINSTRNNPDMSLNLISNNNDTLNFANETAADRMNELVMQSVERIKRRVYGSFAIDSNDDYFTRLNMSTNPTKEMQMNKQFSPASIKPSKLYNMSTTSNFDDHLTENVNQTISFATPSVDLNPVESLKDTTLKDSMSIYFKPTEQQVIQANLNQQEQKNVTFVLNEEEIATNTSYESIFQNKNLNEFNVNDQVKFEEFNQINSDEFKSGSDAFNFIIEDEKENVNMYDTIVNQSSSNNETISCETSKNWFQKQEQEHKLENSNAQDYFQINSTLPSFLANKDVDTTYSMLKNDLVKKTVEQTNVSESAQTVLNSNNDETICDEKQQDSDEMTFSTTKNQISDNFSFTLNASETGDLIIKKQRVKNDSSEVKASTTPFQVTKMLNAYQQKKATASNLKTIGEELDRVSNRLAIQNDSISKTTTITTAITTTTTSDKSIKQKNNQLILTMDETISSINSSSNRSTNLVKQQQKQKITSGSLTSTPSKLNKKNHEKSVKKDDQSEMTSTTSNNLLNQASFISSIPERTNDSTLVGNHHYNQKTKRTGKHAEIQTSPDKSTSSSSSTASFTSDAPTKLAEDKANTITSQMVAINNLAASLLNGNELNSNRTSLFNGSNSTGLIPVAFLPVDAVIPFVQKNYDSLQQKSQIDLSSNSMRQQASSLFADLNNSTKYKLELPILEMDKSLIDFGQIAEECSDTHRICIKLTNTNLLQFNREHNVSAHFLIELKDEDWCIEQGKEKIDDAFIRSKLAKTISVCTEKKQSVKQSIKLDMTTNYYELYIHLNTVNLNFFKDLICQIGNRCDEDDKSLHPLDIQTKLSIYYSSSNTEKYLLNHINLKYMLGYARLRSTVNINFIEFETASLFASTDNDKSNTSRNSCNNSDVDKTLISTCSKDDTYLTNNKNSIEQLIPLSNGGNIPININCYFVTETNHEENNEHKHRILSLKENRFQLKIEKSFMSLDAKSTHNNNKKQIARLTLVKLTDSNQMVSFDDLTLRLIIQVKPNGFKYEIPIKFKLSLTNKILHSNVGKLKKVASLDSTSSTNIAKIASSKSIIFFGKTLSSNVKSTEAGLVNEFTIRNLNDFKVKYELNLVTCLNESNPYDQSLNMSSDSIASSFSSTTLNDKMVNVSSINLFKFTPEMKEFLPKDDSSMTRLIIQIGPREDLSVSVKFNSSLVESDKSNQMTNCYGFIKINTIGYNKRFNVYLVGFLNKSQMCLDTNENKLIKKNDLPEKSNILERQICSKNIQLFNFKYQFTPYLADDMSYLFRKSFKISNKSFNSRLIVYPVLFESFKEVNTIQIENHLMFDLDQPNENFTTKFKLIFEPTRLGYSTNVAWLELAPNETTSFTLEFEFKSASKRKLSDFYDKFEKRFELLNLCLFWIEFDINMQCLNGVQILQEISSNFDSQQVDVFLKKLLSLNPRSFKSYNKSDRYFVNPVLSKKDKLKFDNMLSLMSQALKCSNIKMSLGIKSSDQSINATLNTKEQTLLNDSIMSLNESKTNKLRDESWSLLNDTIVIENLKFDLISNYSARVTIRNNLPKTQLIFNTAFNAAFLDIEPNRGSIQPLRTLDLIVKVRKEIVKQLPWHGIITVISNKTEKDAKISIYSNSAPSKSILSTSASVSSLTSKTFRPPAPIPSLTLPQLSVKSKLNEKNSINSLSLSESSPFVSSSTASNSSTYLEQATVVSDISQNTINDSFSLTPLINASFQQMSRSHRADDSNIRVFHFGNHAQIQFSSVCASKRKTLDFTLMNPTNNFVNWKAYSSNQMNNSNENLNSRSTVFKLIPNVGVIQANEKQTIKIEFCPNGECGNFEEIWEIETRTSSPINYNCKFIISGKSVLNDEDQSNVLCEYNNNATRLFKSTSNLSKYKSKENCEPLRKELSHHYKTMSEYDQILDSSDHPSLLSNSILNRRIIIKSEEVIFPETHVGGKVKSFIVIDNKEDKRCHLNIISITDPFYCKHLSIEIESKHYIKVPVEFRPRTIGDYAEKVLIRVDNTDIPLTCVFKAKCIASK